MPEVTARDIAAVVVLYRPDAQVIGNVCVEAAQVDRVFAVDNTEEPDPAFVEQLSAVPGLTYVGMGDNVGIAAALNAGIARARDAGYSWALTMDQDSTPEPDMVQVLARCAATCDQSLPIGILSPMQAQEGGPKRKQRRGCYPAFTVITSGNLLSIAAWEALGGFDEGLFIDQVDHELCLRMHSRGYSVMRAREAKLLHRLGDTAKHRFLFGRLVVYVTHHSAIRRYYITRNRFAVGRRYREEFPEYRKREMANTRRELAKLLLFEDRRIEKLRMTWRGYRDYRRGVTGPYPGR